MIANGNYMQKEIAYCGESELEAMDYLPVRENIDEIFDHLLRIASDNIHLESEWEEYHKSVYQDIRNVIVHVVSKRTVNIEMHIEDSRRLMAVLVYVRI